MINQMILYFVYVNVPFHYMIQICESYPWYRSANHPCINRAIHEGDPDETHLC